MCKRIRKYIRKLIRSNRKTFKNKLCAIALLSLGMFELIMNGKLTFMSYTLAAMAGICFVSGLAVLSGGKI